MVLVRIYLSCCNIPDNMVHLHCVKSVQLRSFFWSVFSCIRTKFLKSPYSVRILKNMDHKKFRIWTFFTHCYSSSFFFFFCFLKMLHDCKRFSKISYRRAKCKYTVSSLFHFNFSSRKSVWLFIRNSDI